MSASAVGSLEVETAEFKAALQKYMSLTSKTVHLALNGKMRDLLFKAAEFTPIGKSRAQVLSSVDKPRSVAVHRRKKQHGLASLKGIKRSDLPFTTQDIDHSQAKLGSGRGYLRSAFYKAARMFPLTEASSYRGFKGGAGAFTKSKAQTVTASMTSAVAKAWMSWTTSGGPDGAAVSSEQRQRMLENAMANALAWVKIDMYNYFKMKMDEHAKAVSAKGKR